MIYFGAFCAGCMKMHDTVSDLQAYMFVIPKTI